MDITKSVFLLKTKQLSKSNLETPCSVPIRELQPHGYMISRWLSTHGRWNETGGSPVPWIVGLLPLAFNHGQFPAGHMAWPLSHNFASSTPLVVCCYSLLLHSALDAIDNTPLCLLTPTNNEQNVISVAFGSSSLARACVYVILCLLCVKGIFVVSIALCYVILSLRWTRMGLCLVCFIGACSTHGWLCSRWPYIIERCPLENNLSLQM